MVNGAATGIGRQKSFESGCVEQKAGSGAGRWESLASLACEALSALTSSFPLLDSISPVITTVFLGLQRGREERDCWYYRCSHTMSHLCDCCDKGDVEGKSRQTFRFLSYTMA